MAYKLDRCDKARKNLPSRLLHSAMGGCSSQKLSEEPAAESQAPRRTRSSSLSQQAHNQVTFKVALETGGMEWRSLPWELQGDREFARSIACFPSYNIVESIFQHFPDLRNDRDVWMRLIDTLADDHALYRRVFPSFATAAIRADEQVMIRACGRNWQGLSFVDSSLATRSTFWENLLPLLPTNDFRDHREEMKLWLQKQLRFPNSCVALPQFLQPVQ